MKPTAAEIIRVDALSHAFPDGRRALQDVCFEVREGEFLILAGRNGSGKTVLMKHLNGLLRPTSGQVYYRGKAVDEDLLAVRRRLGLVFQEAEYQIVRDTVRGDVAFGPENLRLPRKEINARVEAALKICALAEKADARPSELSGGERRRLAIAGILAMEAETIALDEPFANLDFPSTITILGELVQLSKAGKTLIVLTHELEKLAAHASRIVILSEGRVVCDAAPETVLGLDIERFGLRHPFKATSRISDLTWLK